MTLDLGSRGHPAWSDEVGRLNPDKLHVRFEGGAEEPSSPIPRCYTLTHSDRTGDLYLTVGPEHNIPQTRGWYTRLMRDEVLAEWEQTGEGPVLHVHCHVCGGLALGPARMRDAIFKRELPLVLETIRFGDRGLFDKWPDLDRAPIRVHFQASKARYNRVEDWGVPADYRLEP